MYRVLALVAFVALIVGVIVLSGGEREVAAPVVVEGAPADPGYAASKARLVQTGPDGAPLYTIDAQEVQQQPEQDTVDLHAGGARLQGCQPAMSGPPRPARRGGAEQRHRQARRVGARDRRASGNQRPRGPHHRAPRFRHQYTDRYHSRPRHAHHVRTQTRRRGDGRKLEGASCAARIGRFMAPTDRKSALAGRAHRLLRGVRSRRRRHPPSKRPTALAGHRRTSRSISMRPPPRSTTRPTRWSSTTSSSPRATCASRPTARTPPG